MYKPDDNDIDRLGRNAAERYNAPGTPAWDSLRQRLDNELPQKEEKKRRGFFFFLILLGLLLSGSAVFYGTYVHNKNKEATKETTLAATVTSGNEKDKNDVPSAATAKKETAALVSTTESNSPVNTTSGQPATNTKDIDDKSKADKPAPAATSVNSLRNNQPTKHNTRNIKDKADAPDVSKQPTLATSTVSTTGKNNTSVKNRLTNTISAGSLNNKVAAKKTSRAKLYAPVSLADKHNTVYGSANRKKQTKDVSATSDDVNKEDAVIASNKKNKQRNNKTVLENKQVPEAGTNNPTNGDLAVDNSSTIKNNQPDMDLAIDSKASVPVPDTLNNKIAPAPDTAANKTIAAAPEKKDSVKAGTAKKKSKSKNNRAINIGITAGLDLSTVKFTHNDNVGYNIGIMGGYQFSKHWSVYTGVIYTKKIYELNGNDYHPPTHYWTQYVNLETVEGYCRMWEVPLQARYTFSTRSKTAFFISTGLSSYFMKKQAYNYSYKTMSGTQGYAEWSSDSSFNHFFSILNLSAGFEKQVGKHMNWQVEPYAKIPLVGVGFGDIKLSSFGINLTVQYRKPVNR